MKDMPPSFHLARSNRLNRFTPPQVHAETSRGIGLNTTVQGNTVQGNTVQGNIDPVAAMRASRPAWETRRIDREDPSVPSGSSSTLAAGSSTSLVELDKSDSIDLGVSHPPTMPMRSEIRHRTRTFKRSDDTINRRHVGVDRAVSLSSSAADRESGRDTTSAPTTELV